MVKEMQMAASGGCRDGEHGVMHSTFVLSPSETSAFERYRRARFQDNVVEYFTEFYSQPLDVNRLSLVISDAKSDAATTTVASSAEALKLRCCDDGQEGELKQRRQQPKEVSVEEGRVPRSVDRQRHCNGEVDRDDEAVSVALDEQTKTNTVFSSNPRSFIDHHRRGIGRQSDVTVRCISSNVASSKPPLIRNESDIRSGAGAGVRTRPTAIESHARLVHVERSGSLNEELGGGGGKFAKAVLSAQRRRSTATADHDHYRQRSAVATSRKSHNNVSIVVVSENHSSCVGSSSFSSSSSSAPASTSFASSAASGTSTATAAAAVTASAAGVGFASARLPRRQSPLSSPSSSTTAFACPVLQLPSSPLSKVDEDTVIASLLSSPASNSGHPPENDSLSLVTPVVSDLSSGVSSLSSDSANSTSRATKTTAAATNGKASTATDVTTTSATATVVATTTTAEMAATSVTDLASASAATSTSTTAAVTTATSTGATLTKAIAVPVKTRTADLGPTTTLVPAVTAHVKTYTGRRTGKVNEKVEQKLSQLSRDLEAMSRFNLSLYPSPPQAVSKEKKAASALALNERFVGNGDEELLSAATTGMATSGSEAWACGERHRHSKETLQLNLCHHFSQQILRSKSFGSDMKAQPTQVQVHAYTHPQVPQAMDPGGAGWMAALEGGAGVTATTGIGSSGDFQERPKKGPFRSIRKLFSKTHNGETSTHWRFHSLRNLPTSLSRGKFSFMHDNADFLHPMGSCKAIDEISDSHDVIVTELAEIQLNTSKTAAGTVIPGSGSASVPRTLSPASSHDKGTTESDVPAATPYSRPKSLSSDRCFTSDEREVMASPTTVTLDNHCRSVCASPVSTSSQERLQDNYQQNSLICLSTLAYVCQQFPSRRNAWWRKYSSYDKTPSILWKDLVTSTDSVKLVTATTLYADAQLNLQGYQEVDVTIAIVPVKLKKQAKANRPFSFSLGAVAEFTESLNVDYLFPATKPSRWSTAAYVGATRGSSQVPCHVLVTPKTTLIPIRLLLTDESNALRNFMSERLLCFILVQTVLAFQYLQSQGFDWIASDLDGLILTVSSSVQMPQVVVEWESAAFAFGDRTAGQVNTASATSARPHAGRTVSLCRGALMLLNAFFNKVHNVSGGANDDRPPTTSTWSAKSQLFFAESLRLVASVLHENGQDSLTHAKNLLQYLFWVSSVRPSEEVSQKLFDKESVAQTWLEGERMKILCQIIKKLLNPDYEADVADHYCLLFLLHATAKTLVEAEDELYQNFQQTSDSSGRRPA